uniref:P-type domain-containing protein n=1 Tax=Rhabditophanes sp. KR3021 TaxID=114890 RepID=A0AC35U578_9BILA
MLRILLVTCALVISSVSAATTVDPSSRLDCFPEPGANRNTCEARGCYWDVNYDSANPTVPLCYFPANSGYSMISSSDSTYTLRKYSNTTKNPYGIDFDQVVLSYSSFGSALKINIKPSGSSRYVPPVQFNEQPILASDSFSFTGSNDANSIFGFSVMRNSNKRRIFDTSIGGLFFSDKFIQIATYLPSHRMFGVGEHIHKTLSHDLTKYTNWAMLARDQPPNSKDPNTNNLYGVHPFYMIVEPDNKAHGVLFINSNAQEIVTGPAPHLIYRTIGGQLDIVIFPGPTPTDVVKQYTQYVGRPFLPSYWALGYQMCRYGFKNLQEIKDVVSGMQKAAIPFDVIYSDIDYMDRYKDFTIGQPFADFPAYTDQLHSQNMHVILIWDPAIQADYDTFSRGLSSGAKFIEWPSQSMVPTGIQNMYPLAKDTKVMLGVVWPDKHTAFPDFLDKTNKTRDWWTAEFQRFYDKLKFDGIWIDMNEPSNFGTNIDNPWYFGSADHPDIVSLKCILTGPDSTLDVPPYPTSAVYQWGSDTYLSSKTLCMNGVTMNGDQTFYNTKNLYGLSEASATRHALSTVTNKRGAVISRSTFPSAGKYAGHWLGDNTARWEDLQTTIIGVQEFNMFGIPYVGSDVCGFNGPSNEELCLRWQQAASFHSFFRNHNSIGEPDQWPTVWKSVADATRRANTFRYRHLPYLFSLHFEASRSGTPVIKPLFFDFTNDDNVYSIGHQFLWGSSFIVAPVLSPGVTSLEVYLPDASEGWYSVYEFDYGSLKENGFKTYPALSTYNTPTFVRGGSIVPRHQAAITTIESRQNPTELLIALSQNLTTINTANGNLIWDDGETLVTSYDSHPYSEFGYQFSANETYSTLVVTAVKFTASVVPQPLKNIEIFGLPYYPDYSGFTCNGQKVLINNQQSTYSPFSKVLTVTATSSFFDYSKAIFPITLSWQNVVSYKF